MYKLLSERRITPKSHFLQRTHSSLLFRVNKKQAFAQTRRNSAIGLEFVFKPHMQQGQFYANTIDVWLHLSTVSLILTIVNRAVQLVFGTILN
jgi:hypothetical protein